jgi:hypothetical protein
MACLIFLLFLGAYIFVLLYLNAQARPGQGVPERLKPLKYAVNSVGFIFLALFLMAVGVLLLVVIYCSLTDCPLIE